MSEQELSAVISGHVNDIVARVQHLVITEKITKDAATQTCRQRAQPTELTPAKPAESINKASARQRLYQKMRREARVPQQPPKKIFSKRQVHEGYKAAAEAVRMHAERHKQRHLQQLIAEKEREVRSLKERAARREEAKRQEDIELYKEMREEYKRQVREAQEKEERKSKIAEFKRRLHAEDHAIKNEVENEMALEQCKSQIRYVKANEELLQLKNELTATEQHTDESALQLTAPNGHDKPAASVKPTRHTTGHQIGNSSTHSRETAAAKRSLDEAAGGDSDEAAGWESDGVERQQPTPPPSPPPQRKSQLRRPVLPQTSRTAPTAESTPTATQRRDNSCSNKTSRSHTQPPQVKVTYDTHPYNSHFNDKQRQHKERAKMYREMGAATTRRRHAEEALKKTQN